MGSPNGKTITAKMLRRVGACEEAVNILVKKYGDRCTFTLPLFLKLLRYKVNAYRITPYDIVQYVGDLRERIAFDKEVTDLCPYVMGRGRCTCDRRGKVWILKRWFGVTK